jgi:hypothetical protein
MMALRRAPSRVSLSEPCCPMQRGDAVRIDDAIVLVEVRNGEGTRLLFNQQIAQVRVGVAVLGRLQLPLQVLHLLPQLSHAPDRLVFLPIPST